MSLTDFDMHDIKGKELWAWIAEAYPWSATSTYKGTVA